MGHGLIAILAAIINQPKTSFGNPGFKRNPIGHRMDMTDNIVAGLNRQNRIKMLFGNDDYMDWCLGGNIIKGDDQVVFINHIGGNLLIDDLTKNTVLGHIFLLNYSISA